MRLGILTDIHSAPPGSPDGFWNGPVRFSRAVPRLEHALSWLSGEELDALLVLGDLTDDGTETTLEPVLQRILGFGAPRTVLLGGNHDDALLDRLPVPEPVGLDGATVIAARLRHVGGHRFTAQVDAAPAEGLAVVATHFPVVSRAAVFEQRGLRYAGDLDNAAEIAAPLLGRAQPTLVLAGHLHAPDAFTEGTLLQLVLPPVVESEGWASVVEIATEQSTVAVQTRALDADDTSRGHWAFADGAWRRV